MSDKGTIKIPREDFERHNQARKDLNMTWADYIDGQAPEPPGQHWELNGEISDEELAEVRERLDRIESGVETTEERTGIIKKALENMGAGR